MQCPKCKQELTRIYRNYCPVVAWRVLDIKRLKEDGILQVTEGDFDWDPMSSTKVTYTCPHCGDEIDMAAAGVKDVEEVWPWSPAPAEAKG
jgi:hypothetical protein